MILNKIREKTFVYHDDFTGWANKILNDQADKEHYKEVLKTFYGFYEPLEKKLESLPEWKDYDFDMTKRRKTQFLVEDMKSMGISDEEINAIELCNNLPTVNNMNQALGCIYVLEGATLGGQIVSRKLQESLGIQVDTGSAFFNSYRQNLRPMWKEFSDFITKYSEEHDSDAEIVNASDETYHRFNEWLSKLR